MVDFRRNANIQRHIHQGSGSGFDEISEIFGVYLSKLEHWIQKGTSELNENHHDSSLSCFYRLFQPLFYWCHVVKRLLSYRNCVNQVAVSLVAELLTGLILNEDYYPAGWSVKVRYSPFWSSCCSSAEQMNSSYLFILFNVDIYAFYVSFLGGLGGKIGIWGLLCLILSSTSCLIKRLSRWTMTHLLQIFTGLNKDAWTFWVNPWSSYWTGDGASLILRSASHEYEPSAEPADVPVHGWRANMEPPVQWSSFKQGWRRVAGVRRRWDDTVGRHVASPPSMARRCMH